MSLSEKSNPYEKGKTNNLKGTSLTLDRMLSYQLKGRERVRVIDRVMKMRDAIGRITGQKIPSASILILIVATVSTYKILTL